MDIDAKVHAILHRLQYAVASSGRGQTSLYRCPGIDLSMLERTGSKERLIL